MAVSSAVRVGIIVFLAILLFIGAYVFLSGLRLEAAYYPLTVVFDDIMGLVEQSKVTMAGVEIGYVDSISLNNNQQAVVGLKIDKKYRIPEGSAFVLRVGLLVGEKYIDVIPNRETDRYIAYGVRLKGQVPVRIEDLLPKAQELLASLKDTSEDLNRLITDKRLDATLANVEAASASIAAAMASIQGTVAAQEGDIRLIVSNVVAASGNVRRITEQLSGLAGQPGLSENIAATLESARRTTESLERTVSALEQIAADPELGEDIRATVKGAREAVEAAKRSIQRLGGIFGGGGPLRVSIPTRETNLETLYIPDDGKFRVNLNTVIGTGRDSYLNLGLYDFGVSNKLILQRGGAVGPRTDFRYGIYASRFGVGLDHSFGKRYYGTLNAFDPSDPTINLTTGYRLNDDVGLLLGVDDALDDNQLTLGVRFTR
ncbi:MAG: MlaD family protein [Armatimonadota bacterium]